MKCIEIADGPDGDGDGDGAPIARHLQLLGMCSCVRMSVATCYLSVVYWVPRKVLGAYVCMLGFAFLQGHFT